MNSKENDVDKSTVLGELAELSCGFDLYDTDEVILILDRLLSEARLTNLGRQFFEDVQDIIGLRREPQVTFASSLARARADIAFHLNYILGRIGYITGGLEGGYLRTLFDGILLCDINAMFIGLETVNYVQAKNRAPLFSTQEKASLWKLIAPENSIIFVIPPRPDSITADEYYTWIAQYLGVYRNPRIMFVGSSDDPPEIMRSHNSRAASTGHVLHLSLGQPPIHTSDLLAK